MPFTEEQLKKKTVSVLRAFCNDLKLLFWGRDTKDRLIEIIITHQKITEKDKTNGKVFFPEETKIEENEPVKKNPANENMDDQKAQRREERFHDMKKLREKVFEELLLHEKPSYRNINKIQKEKGMALEGKKAKLVWVNKENLEDNLVFVYSTGFMVPLQDFLKDSCGKGNIFSIKKTNNTRIYNRRVLQIYVFHFHR